ncbi:DHA2 family efflux MFS transporter permease subunit [Streptomyces sp. JB150]|uniref:DHA2 family efflux MFS transporter permease subunit n=1 Tax=Streptomyces sp. JB150 TaxID=2714844 RepID=UPI0014075FD2|nr:DHA2 family efflux MFS transporter permease subunit [Streptomyces sp. JB150]QIJ65449.1 DHA2 family efflux MFS transporter permease subunit [Streptomyces sp. JB150]
MPAVPSPSPAPAVSGGPGHPLRWPILAVLCLSLLIVGLDVTVLNVALPTLVDELGASTSELQWMVDIYSLMAAGLMLFAGSTADRFGRKPVFLAGLVLFTSASAVAAFSDSTAQLVTARGVMGVGEALIMPATLSIIGTVFTDPAERMKAIGLWSAMIGVGLALGPLVGGWLLGRFWWGSVFLINVPIGVVALLVALKIVPNSRAAVSKRLDLEGAVLSVLGIGTLLWAIIEGPVKGWSSTPVLAAFGAAAVLLVAFLVRERTAREPMLPLSIFAHRRLAVGNVLVFLGLLSLLGALFVLVQYLQFVLGYDAGETGLRIAPTALVILIAAPLASFLGQHLGTRWLAAMGLVFAGVSLLILATTGDGDGYGRVLTAMLFLGFGAGFIIGPTSDAIVGSLPDDDLGVGSATNSAAVQLGAALGVAVLGSLLSGTYRAELKDSAAGAALPEQALTTAEDSVGAALAVADHLPGQAGQALTEAARSAYVSGMTPSMITGAVVAAAGVVVALLLFPQGKSTSGATADEPENRTTAPV